MRGNNFKGNKLIFIKRPLSYGLTITLMFISLFDIVINILSLTPLNAL